MLVLRLLKSTFQLLFLIYIGYSRLRLLHRKGRVVVVLTIIFAILNICLGFALAIYLRNDPVESREKSTDSSASGNKAGPIPAASPKDAFPSPAA
jgi:hypothetical protein